MPVYLLGPRADLFPDPDDADESGLLAIGGDLSPQRLLHAYGLGVFPWYSAGQPILWHSPDPRFVLLPQRLRVGRSLRKSLKRRRYEVRLDTAFEQVIEACAERPRPGQDGTWITDEMREAYVRLHGLGFAHSAEAWCGDELVGGLYGIALGRAFFGESMFAHADDASKVAFVALVEHLTERGYQLIDCQQETEHLARFGAEAWPRARFRKALSVALREPTERGPWRLTSPGTSGGSPHTSPRHAAGDSSPGTENGG